MRNRAIGVFDSGFGGLEILREVTEELPEYDYLYLGDTARAPYGNRSQEIIYRFTKQAVDFLFKNACQLIVLACNTASSRALRKIQREYLPKHYPQRRVLGVLIPASEAAVAQTKNRRIGVIATKGTVSSGAFIRELKKLDYKVKVFQKACPLLVPMVEEGRPESKEADLAIENYLRSLLEKNIDTLILGCTHYGILKEKIEKVVGPNIKLVVEGKIVATKLKDYLQRHPEIERELGKNSRRRFMTTDSSEKFKILGSQFFGKPIKPEKVTIRSRIG